MIGNRVPRSSPTCGVPARFAVPVLVLATLFGCGQKEFEPPSEEERVLEASGAFAPEVFDTIVWEDRESMLVEGAALFGADCRDCHGPLGRGGTAYATERGLEVPSLVAPGWPLDGDLVAVRRRVFTGHTGGMPTHGIAGLTARQIDAVARYLVEQLRPEVLGSRPPGTT